MLNKYTQTEFTYKGETKPVYVRGNGPAVIVIHEIPGITPMSHALPIGWLMLAFAFTCPFLSAKQGVS